MAIHPIAQASKMMKSRRLMPAASSINGTASAAGCTLMRAVRVRHANSQLYLLTLIPVPPALRVNSIPAASNVSMIR
jgi:hypothetical protein